MLDSLIRRRAAPEATGEPRLAAFVSQVCIEAQFGKPDYVQGYAAIRELRYGIDRERSTR